MSLKPRELHPDKKRTFISKVFRDFWHGKSPIIVGNEAITGHLKPQRKGAITRRLNSILKKGYTIKIGAMGDHSVRMDATDYRGTYRYVEAIYKSKSENNVKDLEVYLIKKFLVTHPHQLDNKSTARARRLTTNDGYYYIYVVYGTYT